MSAGHGQKQFGQQDMVGLIAQNSREAKSSEFDAAVQRQQAALEGNVQPQLIRDGERRDSGCGSSNGSTRLLWDRTGTCRASGAQCGSGAVTQ